MSNELIALDPAVISSLVINGDLKGLTAEQKVAYYNYRCQQAGLDPSAKPFDLLVLNGKQVLYANASATQQLCGTRGLSVQITQREKVEDIFMVSARVTDQQQRSTENTGAVSISGLKGESLANAMMKATTKAIRRTVLAHCGLGMLDETEAETIPGAVRQPIEIAPAAALEGFGEDEAAFSLMTPGTDDPYSRHRSLEEWQEAYAAMLGRISNSPKLTPAQAFEKARKFKIANEEVFKQLGKVEQTKLMAQHPSPPAALVEAEKKTTAESGLAAIEQFQQE
jgi:hypothetical protein